MDVHQILQDLFGYASDEEPAPSHEIEQQPEFNFVRVFISYFLF